MRYYIPLILIIITCASCLPEEPGNIINFSITDEAVQEVFRLQDERDTKGLLEYAGHVDATYRYAAATALASVQDSLAVPALCAMLRDTSEQVRYMSAYALGQTASEISVDSLIIAFGQEKSRRVQSAILEAVGKSGNEKTLRQISSVKTYKPSDTLLLEGQTRAIYRFMNRGITAPEGTTRMIELLQQPTPTSVRQLAGDYLRRAKDIRLDNYEKELIDIFQKEKTPNVRMFVASALGKTKSRAARDTLAIAFFAERDYRVKINIIRALADADYNSVRTMMLQAVADSNPKVAYTAAQYLRKKTPSYDGQMLHQLALDATHWRVRAELHAAALGRTTVNAVQTRVGYSTAIKTLYEKSQNPYEKGVLLDALAEHAPNYAYITEAMFDSTTTSVRKSYGIQALVNLRSRDNFERLAGWKSEEVKKALAATFKRAIESGDVAMIATTAGMLRKPELNMRREYPGAGFMIDALKKMQLPRDVEAYNELRRTVNFFRGEDIERGIAPLIHNRPIDWEIINELSDNPTALIRTARGNIELDLLVNDAPGSVANFVKLAQDGFFNDKNFHRIVPNFVVQGGCPRGDGWGSLPYSIRSELGPNYYDDEGYIGMASAGKDTECTQWFITHSPTAHLDGRYTIFGKVISGMDVVHGLEIGDLIEGVEVR